MYKKLGVIVFAFAAFLFFAPSAFAVKFDLIPPSGALSRGQDVTFTVNIDTEGASITTIQTGMTYDTQYLQYVSSAPGSAMTNLTVDTSQGTGKLVFTGSNSSGFTGTGAFGTVVFKIIAESSGETELCTLWAVTPTNTPAVVPTTPPVGPTSPPPPTALPQTGFDMPKNTGALAGGAFLLLAGAVMFYTRSNTYTHPSVSHTKKAAHKAKE